MLGLKALMIGLSIATLFSYGVYESISAWKFTPEIIFKEEVSRDITYLEFFRKSNLEVVEANTDLGQMANIALGRVFPHYRKPRIFFPNQMFQGSPMMTLDGRIKETKDGKSLFILEKNSEEELQNLKQSCIEVLSNRVPRDRGDAEVYRLRVWCTIPTVKEVLRRHKFQLIRKDEEWERILESRWITDKDNHDRQNFFSEEELVKLQGSDRKVRLDTIKNRCNEALDKPFRRKNFPAPALFLKDMEGGEKVDEFQEAALFCTIPTTVESYIKDVMHGSLNDRVPLELKNDFCYMSDKEGDVDLLRNLKTIDPMGGKGFWCAVRLMYFRGEKPVDLA